MLSICIDADVLVFDLLDLYFCICRRILGLKVDNSILFDCFTKNDYITAAKEVFKVCLSPSLHSMSVDDCVAEFKKDLAFYEHTIKPVVGITEFLQFFKNTNVKVYFCSNSDTITSHLVNTTHESIFLGLKMTVVPTHAIPQNNEYSVMFAGSNNSSNTFSALSHKLIVKCCKDEVDNSGTSRWGLINVKSESWEAASSILSISSMSKGLSHQYAWNVNPLTPGGGLEVLSWSNFTPTTVRDSQNDILMRGIVVPGFSRGSSELGIPTANLAFLAESTASEYELLKLNNGQTAVVNNTASSTLLLENDILNVKNSNLKTSPQSSNASNVNVCSITLDDAPAPPSSSNCCSRLFSASAKGNHNNTDLAIANQQQSSGEALNPCESTTMTKLQKKTPAEKAFVLLGDKPYKLMQMPSQSNMPLMPGVYTAWAWAPPGDHCSGATGVTLKGLEANWPKEDCVICKAIQMIDLDSCPAAKMFRSAIPAEITQQGMIGIPAVLSIGFNPYYDNDWCTVEPYLFLPSSIFGTAEDGRPHKFCGHLLNLVLTAFVRAESTFASFGQLIEAIQNDCDVTNNILMSETSIKLLEINQEFLRGEQNLCKEVKQTD